MHNADSAGIDYDIVLAPTAIELLDKIKDVRHQRLIKERIDGLRRDPDKQGKPLAQEFQGFRSLRAVGQRYRIIYSVEAEEVTVYIVAVGLRKEGNKRDIYRIFAKIMNQVKTFLRLQTRSDD